MNISLPVGVALLAFGCGYLFYSKYLTRLFGLDSHYSTPAVSKNDGVDFVPTKLGVLFSHHFAAIAGGGPILGPTLALIYGFNLSWFWIVLGCVFFGAAHDFGALFVCVREGGRSVGEVARKTLGRAGFFLLISFTILSLLTLIVAFLGATVAALTSKYPLNLLGLAPDQTLLKTVVEDGIIKGKIGGIASTSVFIITALAPLVGYSLYVKKIPLWIVSIFAILVCYFSISVGLKYPITISPELWRLVLCFYIFVAAGIPVWVILQPRDFVNSFILYIGILIILVCLLIAGFSGSTSSFAINAPAYNFQEGAKHLGSVWPILFITIACGAISGFHSLVAGGTSCKQVGRETHIRVVAYGGMLLEGLLAVMVLCVVAGGLRFEDYKNIVFPVASGAKGNPILAFSLGLGNLMDRALGIPQVYGTVFGILMVEGFVVTTLDASVRLCRYLFEELWMVCFKKVPNILRSYYVNAGLVVVISLLLAMTNSINRIWPIFGSSNQLLAAFVFIVIAVWLRLHGKSAWFAILPAIFMLITSVASLVYLLVTQYIKTGNIPLVVADIILLILCMGFLGLMIREFFFKNSFQARA